MAFRSDSNPALAWFRLDLRDHLNMKLWIYRSNGDFSLVLLTSQLSRSWDQPVGPSKDCRSAPCVCVCVSVLHKPLTRWQYHIHVDSKHCSWLGLQAMEPAPPLPMLLCKVFFVPNVGQRWQYVGTHVTCQYVGSCSAVSARLPLPAGFPRPLRSMATLEQPKNSLYRASSCSIL